MFPGRRRPAQRALLTEPAVSAAKLAASRGPLVNDRRSPHVTVLRALLLLLLTASAAGAQVSSVTYYEFHPPVVRIDRAAPVLLTAEIIGTPTQVFLEPAGGGANVPLLDDGAGPDAVGGDGIYTVELTAASVTAGLQPDDVFKHFIGWVNLFDGGMLSARINAFALIYTPEIPLVPVISHGPSAQSSQYVLNIVEPGFFVDGFDHPLVTNHFYAIYPDDFDFLTTVIAGPIYIANRTFRAVSNSVEGIGRSLSDNTATFGSAGALKGIVRLPNASFFDEASLGFQHELGHNWINQLRMPPFEDHISHWPISNLASGIMGWSTLNGQGLSFNCVLEPEAGGIRLWRRTERKVFSDFDLYLMGLLPPGEVEDALVFPDQAAAAVLANSCDGVLYTGPITTVPISDVITTFGPRVPAAGSGPKRFRVGTILVSRTSLADAETMAYFSFFARRAEERAEVAVHSGLAKTIDNPFWLSTGGRAMLVSRLSAEPDTDLDGAPDTTDNCPNTANPTQDDVDADGVGDACAVIGMVDLGSFGGNESAATAINETSQVVGRSQTAAGVARGFTWAPTTGMQDLGTLGGATSEARDVNSRGQIVGSSETASGETHAFLWDGAAMQDLGTLGPGFTSSVATGINDLGAVVGYSTSATQERAFLWTPTDGMQDLGTLGGDAARASGINNFGIVVGASEVGPLQTHAFVWDAGVMQDLGNIFAGLPTVEALAINDECQVVGWSSADGESGAWILTPQDTDGSGRPDAWNRDDDGVPGNDLMQDLGRLAMAGSSHIAFGLNDVGRVVGAADPAIPTPAHTLHAFLQKTGAGGGLLDLGALGSNFSQAFDVNSKGEVVGTSSISGSFATHPFLAKLGLPIGTPIGAGVFLRIAPLGPAGGPPVTVSFGSVATAGDTDMTSSTVGPSPPAGFLLSDPPLFVDVATTASFSGATVCLSYAGLGVINESALTLQHFEDTDSDGIADAWVDRTVSLDTVNDEICASVSTLSPFALLEVADPEGDGVPSDSDNCPADPNPGQEDADGDGLGDVCDVCALDPDNDADGDGLCANVDVCPDDDRNMCAVLYGVNSADDSLSVVDPATGEATFVAPLDPDPNVYVTPVALTASPLDETLFAWNNSDIEPDGSAPPTGVLLEVDRCTGFATPVDPATPPQGLLQGLAMDVDGQLFGLVGTDLYAIDPATGVRSLLGSLAPALGSTAADFNSEGILYAVTSSFDEQWLLRIDTATLDVTFVATLSQDVDLVQSITFTPSGTLLGSSQSSIRALYDIDATTGIVSNFRPAPVVPQGMDFARVCLVGIAPLSVDFGDVDVGTGVSVIVSVTNQADEPLTIASLALASGGTGETSVSALPPLPASLEPGDSVSVEIRYEPAASVAMADILEINSNEGLNRVPIRGLGVAIDAQAQIAAIVRFIDEAVADGTLTGRGGGFLGRLRLRIFRFLIQVTEWLIGTGPDERACGVLRVAALRADGNPRPRDLVTGPATAELSALIEALRSSVGCR